ncbi:hypothetical protein [Deinococcus multiflagellatus]|uniref:Phage protein n=2 Tax=Deinococcus multiflagellatus TaxID=1656887 RepID=A0ABW1ZP09_9DEIO
MALISYDNSIEVSVMNYLSLNDILRGGRQYTRAQKSQWMDNYFHTKLDFIEHECRGRNIPILHDKQHMTYYHSIRNGQYHDGQAAVPTNEVLSGVRSAAMWVFGMLYDIQDVQSEVDARISQLDPHHDLPNKSDEYDMLLDDEFGVISFGDTSFYASDLLFSFDRIAYRDLALAIQARRNGQGLENE